jgi:UDP:flavonoid glycosyltransferase YjiC (YdhE family)
MGGTSGNLSPLLAARRQLQRNGHCFCVIADPAMLDNVEVAGLPFAT